MKLGKYLRKSDNYYFFWCVGCDQAHMINSSWVFNNDLDFPTFSPSLLVSHIDGDPNKKCHLFITSGYLNYLADSYHSLKNATIPMIPWPEDYPIIGEK